MKKVVILVGILFVLASSIGYGDCFTTSNSAVTYFTDCGCYACAYTGPGCTACSNGTDTCYTDGASCQPFDQSP
jgi:hypothetical protein